MSDRIWKKTRNGGKVDETTYITNNAITFTEYRALAIPCGEMSSIHPWMIGIRLRTLEKRRSRSVDLSFCHRRDYNSAPRVFSRLFPRYRHSYPGLPFREQLRVSAAVLTVGQARTMSNRIRPVPVKGIHARSISDQVARAHWCQGSIYRT